MVEILSVDISKNPVATNERFILSVSVRPYFTTGIGIKGAVPTLISSFVRAQPAGYTPVNRKTALYSGIPMIEVVKIKN